MSTHYSLSTSILQMYGGFPLTKQSSNFGGAPTGCPTIQFNSDILHLELALDPTGKGFSPAELPPPPLQTPITSQGCHCMLSCPGPPYYNLLELRKTFTY